MADIKQQIKEKSFKGAYLLYGEEDFLKDYYSSTIADICTAEGPKEFNLMKLNTKDIDTDSVSEFILSLPFMADRKVLLLKNTDIFSKSSESAKKFWLDIFENLPDYAILIFSENNVDKRSSLFKAISKNHIAEEFPLSKDADLVNWFARILQKGGKSMTKDDIYFVIENVGRNMYLLKNEADKLISFTANGPELISHDDVEKCICKSLEGKIFALIDDITAGNRQKVTEGIRQLKILREKPVVIVSLVFRQFSNLRKIKVMEGAPISEIAQKTKLRDFVVRKNLSQMKRFSLSDLDNAIFLCNEADMNIKQGLCDPWLTVERLAIKIMGTDDN